MKIAKASEDPEVTMGGPQLENFPLFEVASIVTIPAKVASIVTIPAKVASIVTIPAKVLNMKWCFACKCLVPINHTQSSCALNIATDVMES